MREYWILTKLQLSSLFGINKMRHGGDQAANKKQRRSILLLLVVVFAFGNMSVVYSGALAEALEPLGALPAMLGLMATAASLFTAVMSMFQAKGVLVGFGDYDTLMSWPVRISSVAASRVTTLYAYNLFYTLLLVGPAGAIYAMRALPGAAYYPLFLIGLFLLPVIPSVVGGFLGTVITALTAGRKKNAVLNTAAQMVLLVAVMFGSMRMSAGMEQLMAIADQLQTKVLGTYPPALWFQRGVTGDPVQFLLFAAVNAILLAAFIALLSAFFQRVSTRLMAQYHEKNFRLGRQSKSGVLSALYRKEFKRYFASPVYVTNTAFGVVILLVLAVVALFFQRNEILAVLDAPDMPDLRSALPIGLGFITAMSGTTGCSISIEGKQLWIVKSMPVSARDLFLAKILVSLTVAVPATLIACTMLAVAFRVTGIQLLWLFLMPLGYAVFIAVMGLAVNLRMPKLDWKNEAEAVKQSAATMLSVLGSLVFAAIPAVLILTVGASIVTPITTALLFLASYIIWKRLSATGDAVLRKLG